MAAAAATMPPSPLPKSPTSSSSSQKRSSSGKKDKMSTVGSRPGTLTPPRSSPLRPKGTRSGKRHSAELVTRQRKLASRSPSASSVHSSPRNRSASKRLQPTLLPTSKPKSLREQLNLPVLHGMDPRTLRGPTQSMFWIVPGRILCGPYPGSINDEEHTDILLTLLETGIQTFACLQAEVDQEVPPELWKQGPDVAVRPYMADVRYLQSTDPKFQALGPISTVQVHIPDMGIAEDDAVSRAVSHLIRDLKANKTIYLHCWGGHGRTSTVGSIIIGRLYGLGPTDCMDFIQVAHDQREDHLGLRVPATAAQRNQVKRLLKNEHHPTKSAASIRPLRLGSSRSPHATSKAGTKENQSPYTKTRRPNGKKRTLILPSLTSTMSPQRKALNSPKAPNMRASFVDNFLFSGCDDDIVLTDHVVKLFFFRKTTYERPNNPS
eukprot:UC4_evm7s893